MPEYRAPKRRKEFANALARPPAKNYWCTSPVERPRCASCWGLLVSVVKRSVCLASHLATCGAYRRAVNTSSAARSAALTIRRWWSESRRGFDPPC